jgi:uncharacterized OB-fold protein
MNAPTYHRQNKNWSKYLGRRGKVIVASQVKVTTSRLEINLPYYLLLVSFAKEKKELMGVAGEDFKPGDAVECVLRKLDRAEKSEIIFYGLKAARVK